MSLGFAVQQRHRSVKPTQAALFRDIPVSTISDSMHRMTAGGSGIVLLNTDLSTQMAGAALTVRTRPGDNLLVHKALTMIAPGDVLVIDAGADTTNAIIGEIMLAAAVASGLVGLVVDGAIRDAATLRTGVTPVFARGVTHRGPYKDGPGEINVPVTIGGMVVHPGDLVLGDADGIVAIPPDHVDQVHALAAAKTQEEAIALQIALRGDRNAGWVDARIAALYGDGIAASRPGR
ncbi:RraA family protein [soil metagenome]